MVFIGYFKKWNDLPWLVWLSGLSTEGLPVWFPVRAQAWVAAQVPGGAEGGGRKRQPHIDVSLPVSIPAPLSKNK